MPGMMDNLQTINSFIRTVLALTVAGGLGTAGYYGYRSYTSAERETQAKEQQLQAADQKLKAQDQQLALSRQELEQRQQELLQQAAQIAELNQDLEKKKAEIQRLDMALRLHKLERRLARVTVLDVEVDEATKKKFSQIQFVELNEQGDPIGEPRKFRLEGDLVYVDYWVVKFDDQYVEAADLERGTSICLFNRIFGEFQKPKDGVSLDEPGKRPGPYARGGVMSDLEKKIWDDFWNIANSPQQAAELGIRTLHGDAVSIKVIKGKTYRITVRSSGGPEIEVEEPSTAPPPNTASMLEDTWQPPRRPWPRWLPVRQHSGLNVPQAAEGPDLAKAE